MLAGKPPATEAILTDPWAVGIGVPWKCVDSEAGTALTTYSSKFTPATQANRASGGPVIVETLLVIGATTISVMTPKGANTQDPVAVALNELSVSLGATVNENVAEAVALLEKDGTGSRREICPVVVATALAVATVMTGASLRVALRAAETAVATI